MRWKNVPIPETIVVPLALGVVLETFLPRPLFIRNDFSIFLAFALIVLGLALILWSVRVVGVRDMGSPDLLITDGPYALSRNPMYLSWMVIYLAVFSLNPSLWLAILFFPAILLTHHLAILPEERTLNQKFGARYEQYCKKVRRYI
jgi:protein-S-isoprenylcysteine O-methyltransferase Ste14